MKKRDKNLVPLNGEDLACWKKRKNALAKHKRNRPRINARSKRSVVLGKIAGQAGINFLNSTIELFTQHGHKVIRRGLEKFFVEADKIKWCEITQRKRNMVEVINARIIRMIKKVGIENGTITDIDEVLQTITYTDHLGLEKKTSPLFVQLKPPQQSS